METEENFAARKVVARRTVHVEGLPVHTIKTEIKNSNYRMWKTGKKWLYASTALAAFAMVGGTASVTVHAAAPLSNLAAVTSAANAAGVSSTSVSPSTTVAASTPVLAPSTPVAAVTTPAAPATASSPTTSVSSSTTTSPATTETPTSSASTAAGVLAASSIGTSASTTEATPTTPTTTETGTTVGAGSSETAAATPTVATATPLKASVVAATTPAVATSTTSTATLPSEADIVFVLDTTGSMNTSLPWVEAAMKQFTDALNAAGATNIRYGVYSTGDLGVDGPAKQELPLGGNVDQAQNAIKNAQLTDGGDTPEDTNLAAMTAVANSSWRLGAQHFVIDITDAATKQRPDLTVDGQQDTAQGLENLLSTDGVTLEVQTINDGTDPSDTSTYDGTTEISETQLASTTGTTVEVSSNQAELLTNLENATMENGTSSVTSSTDTLSPLVLSKLNTYDSSLNKILTDTAVAKNLISKVQKDIQALPQLTPIIGTDLHGTNLSFNPFNPLTYGNGIINVTTGVLSAGGNFLTNLGAQIYDNVVSTQIPQYEAVANEVYTAIQSIESLQQDYRSLAALTGNINYTQVAQSLSATSGSLNNVNGQLNSVIGSFLNVEIGVEEQVRSAAKVLSDTCFTASSILGVVGGIDALGDAITVGIGDNIAGESASLIAKNTGAVFLKGVIGDTATEVAINTGTTTISLTSDLLEATFNNDMKSLGLNLTRDTPIVGILPSIVKDSYNVYQAMIGG